jgi:ABC-type phosphate transport system substrate-binding protein
MFGYGKKKSAGTGARAALLAGATVAALGLGGLGAGSASAALSCNGSNIIGEGSSLQKIAQQNVWAPAFANEICNSGTHPTVEYKPEGSGAGLKAWGAEGVSPINRTRQFIGTDDAPTATQIANIQAAAGGGNVLVIPVAQTAIAVIANPPSGCAVSEITNHELEQVFRGTLKKWSVLATAESTVAGACNSPITRVVRKDGSGTTYQFKNYLNVIYKNALPCTTGGTEGKATWKELEPNSNSETGAPNTTWPETCTGTNLSTVVKPAAKGGGEEVDKVNATTGSIGYAALPDAKGHSAADILNVQNNAQKPLSEATFANPAIGGIANCAATEYRVPVDGRKTAGASGENVDWSQVFGAQPGIGGEAYPLCTLTYDLAFHGYKAAGFTLKNEQTVHDYLREYIPFGGQGALEASGTFYATLPGAVHSEHNVIGAALLASSKIAY